MKKRKGGLDTIIVTLVFIFIVIVSIPVFKVFSNSSAKTSKNSQTNSSNVMKESSSFLNNNLQGSFSPPFAK